MNAVLERPPLETGSRGSSASDLASAHGRYFALRTSQFDLRRRRRNFALRTSPFALRRRRRYFALRTSQFDLRRRRSNFALRTSQFALRRRRRNFALRTSPFALRRNGAATVLDSDFSSDADGASDVESPYTFTGRRPDAESGLMQYRNRYYEPGLGRFVSWDPLSYVDSLNLFELVLSQVTAHVAPLGLSLRYEDQPDYIQESMDQVGDLFNSVKNKLSNPGPIVDHVKNSARDEIKWWSEHLIQDSIDRAMDEALDLALELGCAGAVGMVGALAEDLRREFLNHDGVSPFHSDVYLYGHCVVACQMTNACGSETATRILGVVNEAVDFVSGGNPRQVDLDANEVGISCAKDVDCDEFTSCAACCQDPDEGYPGYASGAD